ncbi:hypothetical protein ACH3VR_07265 [Microbacterium sp. B2969]|uniref:Tc toxin complex TcA C-terminal TcB-binding domain-containing protein n=1 Tax=Microbacterium alkaliflavum TaxID=3248839 RepID=A0ABW7Q7D8_9MICO
MEFNDASATFLAVSPILRERATLVADMAVAGSGRASDAAKAAVAEVELAIADADAAYQRQSYSAALDGYERARGLIYRFLHPGFDVHTWLGDVHRPPLPIGAVLENSLLEASANLAGVIRPTAVDPVPVTGLIATAAVEPDLVRFTTTGFRPTQEARADLGLASNQALALITDGKPELAVPLLKSALEAAGAPDVEKQTVGATMLTLATALVQTGQGEEAAKVAAHAADAFTAADDKIGAAHAVHTQGIAVALTGDQAAADKLFDKARGAITDAPDPAAPGGAAPGGAAPGGAAPGGAVPGGGIRVPGGLRRDNRDVPVGLVRPLDRLRARVDAPIDRVLVDRLNRVDDGGVAGIPIATTFAASAGLLGGLDSRSPEVLAAVRDKDPETLGVRLPGRVDGWTTTTVVDPADRAAVTKDWAVGINVGTDIVTLGIEDGAMPAAGKIADAVYRRRITATKLIDLGIVAGQSSTTTYYLTHLYAYVLPVKIGDTRFELGQHGLAEESYVEAAGYSYLNDPIESTALWIRLAKNAVEWGSVLYRAENVDGAKAQYGKVIDDQGNVPASTLFTTAGLHTPADVARGLIQHLADRPLPSVQWEIASLVLTAFGFIQQILQGLDYYGLALSPIHTFEYLQSVAKGFAAEAVQAERDYVNFKTRQEATEATRRDLEAAVAMAQAQAEAQRQQYLSAVDDRQSAQAALDLANRRLQDAIRQRDDYAASSWTQIWSQAASTAQGMGSNSWFSEISELADKLDRGESISGERGKLAAAYVFSAGRKNRAYELAKMQDNIAELNAAIPVAQEQVQSAQHRELGAEIAWQAALQKSQLASASLDAFDANLFSADAWSMMASVMKDITRDYMWRAIRIAKLMERAYNFENDTSLSVIKADYGFVVSSGPGGEVKLLGGDGLIDDIESFTYQAIVTKVRKSSRIKDVISIAEAYPAQMAAFRATGLLSFETDLYEFDRLHAGYYGQRIEAVELEFVGLVPEDGINGTLTAGGVTRYRTRTGGVAQRTHVVDTMAVSEYRLRDDVFVFTAETGVRGLFQGIGLGTTWQLHLPKRSNEFDFARIVDVRIVVYYTALFDSALRSSVLAAPPRAGELNRVRDFDLRYDFPEAWYGFYRSGTAAVRLDEVRMPANQESFAIDSVHLRVVAKAGVAASGISLHVVAPSGTQTDVVTDANGVADLTAAAPALVGSTPIGDWQFAVTGGASLTDGAGLHFDRVVSLQLGLDYSFEYPAEAL